MREFRVLAKTLNFNTAADQLHISQPTLTRHIASLEQELGFRLLNRNPMALTAQGRYFLLGCDEVLSRYDEVVRQCKVIARKSSEAIRLNMPLSSNSIWGDIFYRAVPEFARSFPDTPVPYFVHDDFSSIGQSIASGSADVGIVFRPLDEDLPDCMCEKIAELPLAVFFSKSNPGMPALKGRASIRGPRRPIPALFVERETPNRVRRGHRCVDSQRRSAKMPLSRFHRLRYGRVHFGRRRNRVWQCGKHARSQCERETRRPPHRQWLCTLSDLCHVSQASRTRKSRRFRGDMQTPRNRNSSRELTRTAKRLNKIRKTVDSSACRSNCDDALAAKPYNGSCNLPSR